MKAKGIVSTVKKPGLGVDLIARFKANSNLWWKTLSSIGILLIPILEGIDFTDTFWVKYKGFIYVTLILLRLIASFTTTKSEKTV